MLMMSVRILFKTQGICPKGSGFFMYSKGSSGEICQLLTHFGSASVCSLLYPLPWSKILQVQQQGPGFLLLLPGYARTPKMKHDSVGGLFVRRPCLSGFSGTKVLRGHPHTTSHTLSHPLTPYEQAQHHHQGQRQKKNRDDQLSGTGALVGVASPPSKVHGGEGYNNKASRTWAIAWNEQGRRKPR